MRADFPAPDPAPAKIIKLGSYGQAFDAPGDRRAYTYKHQPGNQAAWRLGDAASRVEAGGDLIDCGLSLLKVLEAGGFGVFELDEAAAIQAPEGAQALTETQIERAWRLGFRHACDAERLNSDEEWGYKGANVIDEVEALAAPAPQAPAWQPIETAPRGSGEDGPHDVRDPAYIEPPTLLLWTQEGPRVGYYDWYYHPGYGRGADPHESPWRCAEGGQAYGPTHWMPLPAAPQTKEPKA